jgi:hypothetical protein
MIFEVRSYCCVELIAKVLLYDMSISCGFMVLVVESEKSIDVDMALSETAAQ